MGAVSRCVEKFLGNAVSPEKLEERGVIYIALCSRRYLALCACSVQTLRWAGYEGAVRVLVDNIDVAQAAFAGLEVELVQVAAPSQKEMSSRAAKTQLYDYAPWPQTLYLDCDIIVLRDLAPLWDELNAADLALVKAGREANYSVARCFHSTRRERDWTLRQGIDGTQFNGGVMAWHRNEKTRVFLNTGTTNGSASKTSINWHCCAPWIHRKLWFKRCLTSTTIAMKSIRYKPPKTTASFFCTLWVAAMCRCFSSILVRFSMKNVAFRRFRRAI